MSWGSPCLCNKKENVVLIAPNKFCHLHRFYFMKDSAWSSCSAVIYPRWALGTKWTESLIRGCVKLKSGTEFLSFESSDSLDASLKMHNFSHFIGGKELCWLGALLDLIKQFQFTGDPFMRQLQGSLQPEIRAFYVYFMFSDRTQIRAKIQ